MGQGDKRGDSCHGQRLRDLNFARDAESFQIEAFKTFRKFIYRVQVRARGSTSVECREDTNCSIDKDFCDGVMGRASLAPFRHQIMVIQNFKLVYV